LLGERGSGGVQVFALLLFLVTEGTKPVARISPYQKSYSTAELFKNMRGKVQYFEDLTTPTTEEWTEV